ncbi:hypothetical protein GGI35DRAFT_453160 [Trichoderma velutinum]
MTRGNQRELAREKNLKKDAKSKKGSGDNGYDKAKKTLTNAEIMRQKQAKGPNNQTYPIPVENQ